MGIKWLIIFVLLIPFVSASSVRINEVMYDPEGDDYDFEYIELYGEGEDISGWYFEGIGFSFPLNTSINGYLVIANTLNDSGDNNDFLDKYPGIDCDFEYSGSLLNKGELISLWNEGELVDAIRYYPEWGAESDGKSLCKINNIWQECSATPGSENIENLIDYTIRINEFLPNPIGDDNADMPSGEWIELYNYGIETVDLTGFVLYDSDDSSELYITSTNIDGDLILQPNDYLIVYRDRDIDFDLNNNFDKVRLYDGYPLTDSNLIDEVSYSGSSESYSWALINNDWKKIIPTPGSTNIYQNETHIVERIIDGDTFELENGNRVRLICIDTPEVGDYYYQEASNYLESLILNKEVTLEKDVSETDRYGRLLRYIYVDSTFVNEELVEKGYAKVYRYPPDTKYCDKFEIAETKAKNNKVGIWADFLIKINELFPNPKGYDDASIPEGEWVELYNYGNEINLEGFYLKDNSGRKLVISSSNTLSGTIIKANSYLVIYMNGLFGFLNNDDFEKISLYKDDYLLDEVSYSGSSEDLTWSKVNDKWVLSLPTPGSENYNNESDITSSRIKIGRIYDLGSDNKAKFGQIIKIRLEVYKGDTNKESIKLYIENENGDRVSKESRVNVENKFTDYAFSVPIQLVPNCKEKFSDGIYYIIVSGLDDTDKEEIEIEGITSNLCEVMKENKGVVKESVSSDSESVLNEELITGSVIYEGKSEKQGRYAMYFFCFSLTILIIYLLWKNEQ